MSFLFSFLSLSQTPPSSLPPPGKPDFYSLLMVLFLSASFLIYRKIQRVKTYEKARYSSSLPYTCFSPISSWFFLFFFILLFPPLFFLFLQRVPSPPSHLPSHPSSPLLSQGPLSSLCCICIHLLFTDNYVSF